MKNVLNYVVREPLLLTLLLLSAGGVWAFVELAETVAEGDSHAIDEWMILLLRDPSDTSDPIGPRWLEEMVRDVTALGGYAILTIIVLAVTVYLCVQGHRQLGVLLVSAVVGGVIISSLLKTYFDRPRPALVPHGSYVLSQSFPSGHAMMAATTYLTLGAILAQAERRRTLRIFFLGLGIALTIAVGLSRLYLGVHWPTDVLAGWVAGAAWALACWSMARIVEHHNQPYKDRP